MKIAHIGPSGLPVLSHFGGAVQRRMWHLAAEQAKCGHEVTIFSPGERAHSEIRSGVTIQWVPLSSRRPIRDYEFLVKARRLLTKSGPLDVLHAHGSPDARRILGARARASVQTVDYFRYRATSSRWGLGYYAASLNMYDALMPVSRYCATELRAFYSTRLDVPIIPVANGVDTSQFSPGSRVWSKDLAEVGIRGGKLVVYLGRVCLQKGSDMLGPLAVALSESHPDAQVVAVGPPGQFGEAGRSRLMDELADAGVRCTGAVPERLLSQLLRAATVVVLPTRADEMFGMAALEAEACGVPVVASRLGGIPEATGQGALLFPAGDAWAFHAAVEELLSDSDLHARLRQNALEHAQEFTWAEIGRLTMDVYEQSLT